MYIFFFFLASISSIRINFFLPPLTTNHILIYSTCPHNFPNTPLFICSLTESLPDFSLLLFFSEHNQFILSHFPCYIHYTSSYTFILNSIQLNHSTHSFQNYHFCNFYFYFLILINYSTLRPIHH